jgi:HNH endonuclease
LARPDHPPIRIDVFRLALKKASQPKLGAKDSAEECYSRAIAFLDLVVAESARLAVRISTRLEAQGAAWCVTGGWKGRKPCASESSELDAYDEQTLRMLDDAPPAEPLGPTEKQALVLSRRGQGRFRDGLIRLWGKCALTGCREVRLLRASHLKPWRESSNQERLDAYNGILLAAHLDAALDCGLIGFADSGKLLVSKHLSSEDRKALGITSRMRLPKLHERHVPYLRHHREQFPNVFRSSV